MSIQTSLQKIVDSKTAIMASINNKGGNVTSTTPLSAYSSAIDSLPTGGGITGNPMVISTTVESFTGRTFQTYRYYVEEIKMDNSITSMTDMSELVNLKKCTLSSNLTSLNNHSFSYCMSLSSITIPYKVTEIGNYCFNHCNSLKTVIVLNPTPPVLGSNEFNDTPNDLVIKVPCASIDLYKNSTNWSQYASKIESIEEQCAPMKFVLFNSDGTYDSAECDQTSAVTSGEISSQYSGTVNYLKIGECVTTIGDGAVKNCTGITSFEIPSSVTTIGISSFQGCTGLGSITIPSSVTTIGANAFSGCSSFSRIKVDDDTPPTLGTGAFDGSTCKIYVPSDHVETYKTAWSDYADRIYEEGSVTYLSKIVKNSSTGTGPYIDLDYIPTTGTSFRVEGRMTGGTGGMIYLGGFHLDDNNDYRIFYNNGTAYFDWGNDRINTSLSNIPAEGFIGYNYGFKRLDGTIIRSGQTKTTLPTMNGMQLFCSASTDYGELSRLSIYEGETLVRDYYAAMSGEVAGLYELINGVFYEPNNGALIGVE